MSGLVESTVSRKDILSDPPRRAMDAGESPSDRAPGGPGGRRRAHASGDLLRLPASALLQDTGDCLQGAGSPSPLY